MKFAGYDALVVEGRAERPVYISIREEDVEVKDASHLWGKVTGDAERLLKEEMGDRKASVVSIGLGGENLVRYACIINDLLFAAGRRWRVEGPRRLRRGSWPPRW